MNYMEMFVAVIAVVLFASVAVLINRTMLLQNDQIVNAAQYLQASHLNHAILDEIDAKLFSKQLKFGNIKTNYNITRNISLPHAGGVWSAQITAVDCDSLGIPLAINDPNNIYVRVQVTTAAPGLGHPVVMQRIYTKTHLNL